MTRTLAQILLTMFAVVLVHGCSSSGFTYLADQHFPPRPPGHPIQIFTGEPNREYILLAGITGEHFPWMFASSGGEAIEKMKVRARELGGDAIIRLFGYTAPTGTKGAGKYTGQGYVVRWK